MNRFSDWTEDAVVIEVEGDSLEKSPPWHVEPRGSKWVVILDESGEVVGEHDSEDGAKRHMAALYANAKEDRGE